jgi:hypothetical protein
MQWSDKKRVNDFGRNIRREETNLDAQV